jgi:hypothetical protein
MLVTFNSSLIDVPTYYIGFFFKCAIMIHPNLLADSSIYCWFEFDRSDWKTRAPWNELDFMLYMNGQQSDIGTNFWQYDDQTGIYVNSVC